MGRESGKLGNMLSLMDAETCDRLRIFLQSPWFNRSLAVTKLMEQYVTSAQERKPMLADAALWGELFPKQAFDPIKLKNLRAALQRKLDDFIAQEAFSKDESLQGILLLRQLNAWHESQYFPRYREKVATAIAQLPMSEEYRQLALFHVHEEWEAAFVRLDDRSQGDTLAGTYQHAWQFFQLQTVKFLFLQANRMAMTGSSEDTAQAEAILPMIDAGEESLPALQLYHALLHVYRQPQEVALFDRMRQLLQSLARNVAKTDAHDIYTGTLNHCIRRINAGEAAFAAQLLALYQEMDALDLMLYHGRLPAGQFKNMVGLALRYGEFEWAQMVIDRYGGLIDKDPHGNSKDFNLGVLNFAKGNFAAAEPYFYKVLQVFEDVFFGLDARSFLLRIHYETSNWTGLESLAESFKMYLKRNKRIPKSHRQSYTHTAKFFGRLARLSDWNHKGLQKLRADIADTAFSAATKEWLLRKIDQRLATG